ncbi:hypothetical protein KJ841_03095 [Patescibacteria group bacterium]|nr:hypothetical protein [Patescibacteria group bacterium]
MKYPNFREEKKLWKKGHEVVVGIDEAGRGPLAASVVAAAVCFKNGRGQFSSILIKDSKKLTPKKREEIYEMLKQDPKIEWGIGRVSEKVIDRINILEATKLAMKRAVRSLERKINKKLKEGSVQKKCDRINFAPLDYLIIDGNFGINLDTPQKSIIKADEKVFSCAAASVSYDTELYLLYKNSRLARKSIGSLYDYENLKDYKAFSFDPTDYKIKSFPITGIVKHPLKEIWTIITKLGKKIRVTPDHSLFTLKNGCVASVEVSKLEKGDFIAVAKNTPFVGKPQIKVDLVKVFRNQSTKKRPIFVEGEIIKNVIEENEISIKEKSIKLNYSNWDIYSWKRKMKLPINLLPFIYNGKNLPGASVRAGFSRYKFPPIFSFSKDLFWLLGFYIAEGSKYSISSKRRKRSIVITASDKVLQEKVIKIFKKIGITPHIYGINIEAGSILLNRLLTYLGIRDGASNKNIPSIVFSASKNYRVAFLEGYIAGDGWRDKDNLKSGTVSMRSTSQNLIKDLELLYLSLGKNVSIYEKPYNGQPVLLPQGTYTTNVSDCWDIRELSKNARNTIFGMPTKGIQEELQDRIRKTNLNMQKIRNITNFDLWFSFNRAKTITLHNLLKINKLLQSKKINKLLKSDLAWDEIAEIKKDKTPQDVYDIEVRPQGKIVENFLGEGGVIYHNSVLAKVTRDRMMLKYHKKYPKYAFDRHKGYPTKLHRRIIKQCGFCKIHRRSFRIS